MYNGLPCLPANSCRSVMMGAPLPEGVAESSNDCVLACASQGAKSICTRHLAIVLQRDIAEQSASSSVIASGGSSGTTDLGGVSVSEASGGAVDVVGARAALFSGV
ncbi:MAG: hypothetical protein ACI4NF_02085 [Christensenellales bacterium]